MNSLYVNILGIVETLNEWNEELNKMIGGKSDNVFFGVVMIGAIFLFALWGIRTLNKK